MAQAPSTTAPLSLISQAIAEIHLGRYEEAETALKQAMEKDSENANAIANLIVLSLLTGKDAEPLVK
jgi:coatomer subunit epsilon